MFSHTIMLTYAHSFFGLMLQYSSPLCCYLRQCCDVSRETVWHWSSLFFWQRFATLNAQRATAILMKTPAISYAWFCSTSIISSWLLQIP